MPVGSTEPAEDPTPAAGRPRRVIRWLPAVVAAVVLVVALVEVADATAPQRAEPSVTGERPVTPVLSLRRDPVPLADATAERRLRDGVDAFLATQPADTCLHVDAGEIVIEHRVDDLQSPASSQKLLTAVAALTELGPDHTYETVVATAAPVVDGALMGDLHLIGGGDPILSTPAYAGRFLSQPQIYSDIGALADAVVAAGVIRIDGAVVGDEQRYDTVRYHPAWPSRFIAQDQTGPLSALSVNDGFASFPDRGRGPVVPADDPARLGAEVLTAELAARGVAVLGPARSGHAPPEAVPIGSHRSPTVAEVVAQMLRESDNATAELVMKELGLRRGGTGTFEAGARAVEHILQELGLPIADGWVVDGSGLAGGDQVTCAAIDALLAHDPTEAVVRSGLAVAGELGTLRNRFLDTPLEGRLRAKTGTLNQVTALAGYVAAPEDEPVRFTLIANVAEPDRIDLGAIAAQEQLATVLAAHPDRPDLDELRPRPPR